MTDRVKTEPIDYKNFFFKKKLKKKEKKEGRKKGGERETGGKSGKQIKHQKIFLNIQRESGFGFWKTKFPWLCSSTWFLVEEAIKNR